MPPMPQWPSAPRAGEPHRVYLGGAAVDLREASDVVTAVRTRLGRTSQGPPLAVASANLDHVHHFGTGGASRDGLDAEGNAPVWLILLDGVPLARRAASLTGTLWPRLAGSDLLPELLAAARAARARVGFLGGFPETHERLAAVLARGYEELRVAGFWAPAREDLSDPKAAAALAGDIRRARVDLLVVSLGKPRQELWIQRHALASGARVLLAFGAASEFLAGSATRAPLWARRSGMEWLYRLVREPRRLWRRYCVQAPAALWRIRTGAR